MFKKLALSLVVTVSAATVFVVARGAPRVGVPVIEYGVKAAGSQLVTVAVTIPDEKFIVSSVFLTRVDTDGKALPVDDLREERRHPARPSYWDYWLGMHDDGTRGDMVAKDRVFARRLKLPPTFRTGRFAVIVSFAGADHSIRSAPFVIDHTD